MGGHGELALVRTRGVYAGVEGNGRAEHRFERHGTCQVGNRSNPLRAKQREPTDSAHCLGAIQESEALLGSKTNGFDPGGMQGGSTLLNRAAIQTLALANQSESQVSEGSEIAAGADGSFFRNDRINTALQHGKESFNYLDPATAIAEREHIGSKQHHGAGLGDRKRRPKTAGVTADEVQLERVEIGVGNMNVRQLSKARVDSVYDLLLGQ